MLDHNDFKALREMFGVMLQENNVVFRAELRDEMHDMIVASEKSIVNKLRDEMRGMIFASEESIVRQVRDEMHSLVRASEHRVISQVTNFIALSIVPQIDDHDTRITRLEQKTV